MTRHDDLESRLKDIATYVGYLEDGSDAWHAHRNDGIGASTAPAVMGMSPFKSAVTEWAERTGRQEPSVPTPEQELRFRIGHAMEYSSTVMFQELFPQFEVFDSGSWRNKTRHWQTCNPDRLIYDPATDTYGVLELKCSGHGVGWRSELPPLYYVAQVKAQLSTLGLEWGYLFCIIGNSELKCYKIHLDTNKPIIDCREGTQHYESTLTEQIIIDCCEGFLECVMKGTPPAIDGSVSAWQTIQQVNNTQDKNLVYDTDQSRKEELFQAYGAKQDAEKHYNQVRSQLFYDMGEAGKARYRSEDGTMVPFASRRKGPGGKYTLYLNR